jgi:hypothetical protein
VIYVHRDKSLIPDAILRDAEQAQQHLETLATEDERRDYIKRNSKIWRAFGQYLAKMSHQKCWYSESLDPHSFFDVDHYRPKLRAQRTENEVDDSGYKWLAFSWENLRYAANCANRRSTNHETGFVEGKGDWFPLLPGSTVASWNNRCIEDEKPLLLDPVNRDDVSLVHVSDDGTIVPSRLATGSDKQRVIVSAKTYGLNLPRLKEARLRHMREVKERGATLLGTIEATQNVQMSDNTADLLRVKPQIEALRQSTLPSQPYSAAARHVLISLGLPMICAQPEDLPRSPANRS